MELVEPVPLLKQVCPGVRRRIDKKSEAKDKGGQTTEKEVIPKPDSGKK